MLIVVETQAIEKALDVELPNSLEVLLTKQDGGLWFEEYEGLSFAALLQLAPRVVEYAEWKSAYIPFASNVDEDLLIVDGSDADAVYEFSPDQGRGTLLADSFSEYLENYRNDLLAGKFEFIEDVGIVEKARK